MLFVENIYNVASMLRSYSPTKYKRDSSDIIKKSLELLSAVSVLPVVDNHQSDLSLGKTEITAKDQDQSRLLLF